MKFYNGNELINGWLKYHNTTIEEVFDKNPHYKEDNRQFFLDYAVTHSQHEEWEKWAKNKLKIDLKLTKKRLDLSWPWVYLDCSPNVIK
jgi:hypothetical protein